MTEQQLREKLQFAYGNMPDATRAAFEHSLTHHRAPETLRSIGLNRTMRIVITAVLMALMLTAVGVAAARFFSVTDVHPAQDGTEGACLECLYPRRNRVNVPFTTKICRERQLFALFGRKMREKRKITNGIYWN